MKKKTIGWLIALSTLFLLIGYGIGSMMVQNKEPTKDEDTEVVVDEEIDEVPDETNDVNQTLAEWLPRSNDVLYQYEGTGNEFATFNWFPQFNAENYYQIAKDNSGTVTVEVYEYHEAEIIRVFSRPETYFRDNFTEIDQINDYKENEVILKQPIAEGTSWTTDSAAYEITATEKEIDVPAGNYQTIEVTIETDDSVIKRYYAENIGLVYETFESEGFTVESKLQEIKTDATENIPLTVYQADDQLMGIDRLDAQMQLKTNEAARIALQALLSGQKEGYENIYLLPEGTEINYLFLNSEDIVEVDLSSEYITNMNAGSSGESFYLTGLGNTLSQYYGVDNVRLTIDGENYEGGHILLRDNDYLIYDDAMVNE